MVSMVSVGNCGGGLVVVVRRRWSRYSSWLIWDGDGGNLKTNLNVPDLLFQYLKKKTFTHRQDSRRQKHKNNQ